MFLNTVIRCVSLEAKSTFVTFIVNNHIYYNYFALKFAYLVCEIPACKFKLFIFTSLADTYVG